MFPNKTLSLTNKLELLKNINFNNILDGTQKTLNVINQAIPIFNQIIPLINNTKTLFKLTQIINEPENKEVNNKIIEKEKVQETKKELSNNPIFYI